MRDIVIYLIIIVIASNVLLITSIILSKWFRRWKNRKLRRGLINYLGLSEWFSNLNPDEQDLFKLYYGQVAKSGEWVNSLTEGRIYSTSEKPARLLWIVAANAILNNSYQFAEKLLYKAQHSCQSPWERQQVHIAFAFLYFRQRDLLSDARENCIHHCEAAIRNIERYGSPENIPTLPFDHLISIYEEMKDFEKAQAITRKAIEIAGRRNEKIRESYERKLQELKELTRL
ncbi:MAG: hypothetical protein ACE5OP_05725 [Candidatus Glassbacteria bacterium]